MKITVLEQQIHKIKEINYSWFESEQTRDCALISINCMSRSIKCK